jgi:hypothetical protein
MKTIDSVLGFNMDIDLKDNDGNPVKMGAKIVSSEIVGTPSVGTKIGGQKWFTNFNDQLLNKIRDYRRIND